jgi:hypothetical protein
MIVQCCQFCVKKIKALLSLYSEGREYNLSIGQAQFISNYSIMHRSKPHPWPCALSVEWLLSLVASPCLAVPLHIRNANVLKQRIKMCAMALCSMARWPSCLQVARARRKAKTESGRQHKSRTRCLLPWHHGCSDAISSKCGGSLNASCSGSCK